jgi:hypothetical protein
MNDPGIPEPVRRVLARDQMLMMAADADVAVGIVRDREALESSLFDVALKHHLAIADSEEGRTERSNAWRYAGIIVRFCELVGSPVDDPPYTAEQMHAKSLDVLKDPADPDAEPLNLAGYAFNLYRAARDLRVAEDYDAAMRLSAIRHGQLNGGGAEPYTLHLLFENAAAYIAQGQAADVPDLLSEWDYLWKTRAAKFSTRYRCDFIGALAHWARGQESQALDALTVALRRVDRKRTREENLPESPQLDRSLEKLSVVLAKAELLAAGDRTEAEHAEAVALGDQALELAHAVRGRWGVVARSRAPLAIVFHRVFGDLALLAASLPGRAAAEQGLRVALSAKQTGFAARMRAGRHTLLNSTVIGLIEDIMRLEQRARSAFAGRTRVDEQVDDLRNQLARAVSRMLADTVLPLPRALDDLAAVIGRRWALDYVELNGSLARTTHLFRTLIEPSGRITFEEFHPDPSYREFFEAARSDPRWPFKLPRSHLLDPDDFRDFTGNPGEVAQAENFDWRELAASVLPAALTDQVTNGDPIDLLVSAHSWLSLIPWPALQVGENRTRLIERAVVTQTPVLTCLQHPQPPPVQGRALIRLVGKDEGREAEGVAARREKVAWCLDDDNRSQPLSTCIVPSDAKPELSTETLTAALEREDPGSFLHIASHGSGQGLDQALEIPDERISFGRALGLHWPPSVLMASCHVGQVINTGSAEPLSMVMALLTGGARSVVAGIASVGDRGTATIAGHIVEAIRQSPTPLDVALRNAQIQAARGTDELQWALLAAYTQ